MLADQTASSITNFGAAALAAGLLSAQAFGAWALAFAIHVFVLSASRTWTSEPFILLHSGSDRTSQREAASSAALLAVLVGGVAAIGAIAAASFATDPLAPALVGVGLGLPGLLAHDALRSIAVASDRPEAALRSNVVWLVSTVTALMVLRRLDFDTTFGAVLSWALPASLSAAVIASSLGLTRAPVIAWARRVRLTATRLSIEALIVMASGSMMLIVVTALSADLASTGALRGAQVILGPATVFLAASGLFLRPRIVRVSDDLPRVFGMMRLQSSANVVVTAAVVLVGLAVPDRIGVRLFGHTWEGAQANLALVSVGFFGLALLSGPISGLRATHRLNQLIGFRLAEAAVVVTSTVVGARLVTDRGAIGGFGLGAILAAALGWAFVSTRAFGEPTGLAADRATRSTDQPSVED